MDLELRALNVMIGANGSGKSNLISYFKMLNAMMTRSSGLQGFVAESGFAQSVLHHGSKITSQIEGSLTHEGARGTCVYKQILKWVPPDQLTFDEESFGFYSAEKPDRIDETLFAQSQQDTAILSWLHDGRTRELAFAIQKSCPYHFDDTSMKSPIRQHVYDHDEKSLASDGRNLAAVLAGLQEWVPNSYKRILSTIRLIAPYFGEFDLKHGRSQVILNWYEKNSDVLFGPHQISDGTLRAMCLITLLLLPDDQLPSIIIVDEPELGLHPYAISVIASLFKSAAERTQVLVSTQSTAFLDHFEPEDIIIVDRVGKESKFSRPDAVHFKEWLEDYTVSQDWEKNVFGGGPAL